MAIKMKTNYLRILVDDDYVQTSKGFLFADFGTDSNAHKASITGRVLNVCDELYFHDHGKPQTLSRITKKLIAREYQLSMDWATTHELNPGDRVMFRYQYGWERDSFEKDGNVLLIPYEAIVCKLDPVVPVNGYLLIEAFDQKGGVVMGEVKYAGKPNFAYRGLRYGDNPKIGVGSKVGFSNRHGVRTEADCFRVIDSKSRLWRIQRKDVLLLN